MEKAKASNCERIDQVKNECPMRPAENHSSLRDELRVHDGPNEASILQTNVCSEENQLDKLVFQPKDDKYEITTHNEDGIVNASNVLRYNCKKRPDATSIPDYLERTSNADKRTVLRILQSLQDTSRVHIRMIKGKESYFIGKSPSLEETQHSNGVEDLTMIPLWNFWMGLTRPLK